MIPVTNGASLVNDAHVHMGYFPRLGCKALYYYSPRRILGALTRGGVNEFIVSSTNAVWDETGEAMCAEAKEMKRLSGKRAHLFFWVSGKYLAHDPDLNHLPGFYEGFKLHGGETDWLGHPRWFRRILAIARERRFKVQIHTGINDNGIKNHIDRFLPYCHEFPEIKFDLAHGRPADKVQYVLARTDNVWVDTGLVFADEVERWLAQGIDEHRILFGSDLPAPQRYFKVSMPGYLRSNIAQLPSRLIRLSNFHDFLG